MPPQNPQAVLRDSNGNRVGTFYRTADGKIALHNDTDGSEITLDASGLTVESLNATSATVAGERPAGESELYTTPKEVGTQKESLSLSRAGDLVEYVGEVLPAGYSIPSIIHAGSAFDNPLGEWYIYAMNYTADHRNYLFYADNIEGPYTNYGAVLEPYYTSAGAQAEGPSVLHVPEENEVWMYYHEIVPGTSNGGEYASIQETYLATAPTTSTATTTADGTSFTQYPSASDAKPILPGERNGRWDGNNKHYATIRRHNSQWYCIYRATDKEANSVPFGYGISSNGIDWSFSKYPPAGGLLHDSWEPTRENKLCRLFPSLVEIGGELVALWVQDGTTETRALGWDQLSSAQPDSWIPFTDQEIREGESINYGPYTYFVSRNNMLRIDWRDY